MQKDGWLGWAGLGGGSYIRLARLFGFTVIGDDARSFISHSLTKSQ